MKWKRLQAGLINEPILDYLEKLIEKGIDNGEALRVCVGTDSQRAGAGYNYATAIVLVSEGKGGMIIYSKEWTKGKPSLNERMLLEVQKSIEVSYEIFPLLDLYDIKLEVHADINQNPEYDSNTALKQAIGYIQGMGYDFKVKPDAFSASYCADKLCH